MKRKSIFDYEYFLHFWWKKGQMSLQIRVTLQLAKGFFETNSLLSVIKILFLTLTDQLGLQYVTF